MQQKRYHISITGIVQGVGFRPYVYSIAKMYCLNGWVLNSGGCVLIEVEGEKNNIDGFIDKVKNDSPKLAKIKDFKIIEKSHFGYKDFKIRISDYKSGGSIFLPPDVCICDDCLSEMYDSKNPRFRYPFINCTNCGPRFTIIKGVPYDRLNTTMNVFNLCEDCNKEYINPSNRRFHAEPISCYKCGPKLILTDNIGNQVIKEDIIVETIRQILGNKIIAVKGLGGYNLVCDAASENAVSLLRNRKLREDKPFAIMVKDIEQANEFCYIDEAEKKLLLSVERPIVILKRKKMTDIANGVAPNNNHLGIMLPSTPLHYLLFDDVNIKALVVTSGNISSEPIYYKDNDAISNLCNIADYFLTNDREIYIRVDDSVTRTFENKEYIQRRARGHIPKSISLNITSDNIPTVLACGGELKNTFCINKKNEAYISHHIGDLKNIETLNSFEEGILHFKENFNLNIDAVAYDMHPLYESTKYALLQNVQYKIPVQHHHAHIASCMAENNLSGDVIGVAFDGTGYGDDENIWGGEFFKASYLEYTRFGQLDYTNMPSAEGAIKEPWKMAVSFLKKASIDPCEIIKNIDRNKIMAISKMCEKNFNSPKTSSMGRLFDAVSSILGIRHEINFEGQAAIELEQISETGYYGEYETCTLGGQYFIINTDELIATIVEDVRRGVSKSVISSKFHETISSIVLNGCQNISKVTNLNTVVLSGGVFQNMTLLKSTYNKLINKGFLVYVHSAVPTNDGGISLGQIAIALNKQVSKI